MCAAPISLVPSPAVSADRFWQSCFFVTTATDSPDYPECRSGYSTPTQEFKCARLDSNQRPWD